MKKIDGKAVIQYFLVCVQYYYDFSHIQIQNTTKCYNLNTEFFFRSVKCIVHYKCYHEGNEKRMNEKD